MRVDNSFNLNSNTIKENINTNFVKENNFESKLKKALNENNEKDLKKTCMEFETIFTKIVFKEMKATIMKSNLIEESSGREMFESMLDDKLTEESSKAGGLGLGEMLFKQLKKDMMNQYKR